EQETRTGTPFDPVCERKRDRDGVENGFRGEHCAEHWNLREDIADERLEMAAGAERGAKVRLGDHDPDVDPATGYGAQAAIPAIAHHHPGVATERDRSADVERDPRATEAACCSLDAEAARDQRAGAVRADHEASSPGLES